MMKCLSSASDRDKFHLLPSMMQTLTDALNSGEDLIAQIVSELSLDELSGTKLKSSLRRLVAVFASVESLEEGIGHFFTEAWEGAPGMMRMFPDSQLPTIFWLFEKSMEMLLDIEDKDAVKSSNYRIGMECLYDLSLLSGNTVFFVASYVLPVYLDAPEWQNRHAALIAFAQIAKGCSKAMTKNLHQVVIAVLNSFQDPHPRVQWAAVNAIGQLSEDLSPDLQVQYHQQVLPALTSVMDEFQNSRVQAHAASAILNFNENCSPDILTPYLDGIVSKLLVLLKGKQMVQEHALAAFASVANSSQEHFQKYYDHVIPCLKDIQMDVNDKSNRMLLTKSMKCISLAGMAVGKDKFRDDAKEVMEVLMTLQGFQMERDDPTRRYMLQTWAILCMCLGQDFLPYLDNVMPLLLKSVQLEPDFITTSADSDADIDVLDNKSIKTFTFRGVRYGMKISILGEKITACNILGLFADVLKEGFHSWIDQVTPTVVHLLNHCFHKGVRESAVIAMPKLLHSAKLATEMGKAPNHNESYLKELFDYIIPSLVGALHMESETEIIGCVLDALNECVQVSDCVATLVKTFKASFIPFFNELSWYIKPLWGGDKTAKERKAVVCIFYEVAEQCREAALKYYDTYLPILFEACNDENPDVRQGALYGIGVCAEFGGAVFSPHVGEALSTLFLVMRHPNAPRDNILAYGNAVWALGKICHFHLDSIDAAQVVPAWLNCLPIKGNLIVAEILHDQLCSMVERSDGKLLGPNNQNIPKILDIFAEVLCAGLDLATEQTASRMSLLSRQLQLTLASPPEAPCGSSMTKKRSRMR